MATTRNERRRQWQCVGYFWYMVMQAIMVHYDNVRCTRRLPRTPHRNWDNEESVNDFEELNDDTDPSLTCSRKRKSEDGTSKTKRRRTKPIDDSVIALSTLAELSKKIATAMEMQATLDTFNHINWQMILDKLRDINLEKRDVMQVIKAFKADESSARVFMNLTNGELMHDLVFETLGRDPPSHAP